MGSYFKMIFSVLYLKYIPAWSHPQGLIESSNPVVQSPLPNPETPSKLTKNLETVGINMATSKDQFGDEMNNEDFARNERGTTNSKLTVNFKQRKVTPMVMPTNLSSKRKSRKFGTSFSITESAAEDSEESSPSTPNSSFDGVHKSLVTKVDLDVLTKPFEFMFLVLI